MINFHFWSSSHFISWFNKNWHLEIYDSSWLVDFSDSTSTYPSPSHLIPRCQDSHLLFSDVWFIMAESLLILFKLSSCLTHHFMSSINSFLKTFFLWLSCFHRYLILSNDTWSILSWLWPSHKSWTKLIFIFFLFMCFSCLA
jgi:hypothetical protein